MFISGGTKVNRGLPQGFSSKESSCNAGDTGEEGEIPGLERSPGGGNGTYFSILARRIPWTEEPDRVVHGGSKELDMTE